MAIYNIYSLEQQIEILWTAGEKEREFEEQRTPKSRRFYFSKLATEYGLIKKLEREIEEYERGYWKREELTTNGDIAKLFGVRLSTVYSYLSKHMAPSLKSKRGQLCLEKGRANGWQYLKNSGKLHTLTKDDNKKAGESTIKLWQNKA